MMKKIKPYGNLEIAKIMVIGSENQIHSSNKKNEDFCFFSDYFFKPIPSKKSELKKYKTACHVFSLINYLTNFKYTADQIYLTYLWNEKLATPEKNKQIFIPEKKAKSGSALLLETLVASSISSVFLLGQQVNYWLQKFKFYYVDDQFIKDAESLFFLDY